MILPCDQNLVIFLIQDISQNDGISQLKFNDYRHFVQSASISKDSKGFGQGEMIANISIIFET